MSKKPGDELPPRQRTFRVRQAAAGDHFRLYVTDGGLVRMNLSLTAQEVRELADTCLSALGWTPYDYKPPDKPPFEPPEEPT